MDRSETIARCALLALLLGLGAACGDVSETPPDAGVGDGDAGDGDGDAGMDAGPSLDLRAIHVVRGELATDLFATDVVDGAIGDALPLSGGGGSSPIPSIPLVRSSADGTVVTFPAGPPGEVSELFVARIDQSGVSAPIRISVDQAGGTIIDNFLAASGDHVIYSRGSFGSLGTFRTQYFFVDLSGPSPGAPVPLGAGDSFVGPGALSADGSKFVFPEDGAAFLVDVSGPTPSAAVAFTPAPPSGGGVINLVLSADGSKAVVVGDLDTNDVFELYVADLSGATPGLAQKASGPLVPNGDVSFGVLNFTLQQISDDGGTVSYIADADTDEVQELYVVDVSGATPGPAIKVNGALAGGGAVLPGFNGAGVELAPDGKSIAYLADERSDEVVELFYADLSGATPGPAQRVSGALTKDGDVTAFAVAPDGSGLAYLADQNTDSVGELFYVDLRGAVPSAPKRINGDLGDGNGVSSTFVFSPDGSRLAYAADEDVDGRTELYLGSIASGAPTGFASVQVPTNETSSIKRPAFSAGGDWLAYIGSTESPNNELWAVDLRGGTPGPARALSSGVETPTGVTSFLLRPAP